MPNNTAQIRCAYKSKYKNERKNQVILLMITYGEKWHYLALKSEPKLYNGKLCNRPVESLSKLLRGKSSNHHRDYYCLNCFNSYSTKNGLKEHEDICNKNDSCRVITPRWDDKILKYNYGEKCFYVKIILENLTLKEKLSMNLLAG